MNSIENLEEKKYKKKNPIYRILIVVLSIVLVITLGLMGYNWWKEAEAERKFQEMANMTVEDEELEIEEPDEPEDPELIDILSQRGIEVPEKNLDWDAIKAENEHIYAWIYLPGTNIDYPILQHPTDDVYYLEHNVDGSKGYPGCIYSEHVNNTTDFMDFHTVLYGHNMKNGTMFQNLHLFRDESFFDENQFIYVYTPETVYVYEIFASYVHNDEHLLLCYDTVSEEGKQEYLDVIEGIRDMSAHFRDGIELTTENHLLTMSTCTGDSSTRYLVQCVLVNDPTLGYK